MYGMREKTQVKDQIQMENKNTNVRIKEKT